MHLLGKLAAAFALAATPLCITAITAPAVAAGGPCSLLTQGEATKYLGTAVNPGKFEHGAGGDPSCRWSNPSHTKNVLITVDTKPGDAGKTMQMLAMSHAKNVPGVGYYMAGTMFMQKRGALLTAAIYKSGQSMQTMDSGLAGLGRLVLGRY